MFRIRAVTEINPKSGMNNETEIRNRKNITKRSITWGKILFDKDILLIPCEKENQTLSFSLDFSIDIIYIPDGKLK